MRAVLTGADAIASAAGRADDWACARDCAARLLALGRAHGAGGGAERTALAAAVRSVIGAVASYGDDDVEDHQHPGADPDVADLLRLPGPVHQHHHHR